MVLKHFSLELSGQLVVTKFFPSSLRFLLSTYSAKRLQRGLVSGNSADNLPAYSI